MPAPTADADRLPDAAVFRLLRRPDGALAFAAASAGAGPLVGVPPADLLADADQFLSRVEEADRARLRRDLDRSAATLAPVASAVRVRGPAGDLRWVELRAAPARADDGAVAWDGLLLDATDRRRAELVLAAGDRVAALLGDFPPEEALWPALLPALGGGLLFDAAEAWRARRGGGLRRVAEWHRPDPALRRFAAASADWQFAAGDGLPGRARAAGKPVWMPDLSDEGVFRRAALAGEAGLRAGVGVPVVVGGECAGVVTLLARSGGQDYPALRAFLASLGRLLSRYLEQRRAEREVRRARDAAERAGRVKDRFLATVSHDLRTPLAGILHLADTPSTDARHLRGRLRGIRSCARSLLGLVNDLLDTASLSAGKLALRPEPFRPRPALRRGLRPLAKRAADAGVAFRLRVGRTVPEAVVTDPGRLLQIVGNLAGNAVKFTPAGGSVVVSVTAPEGRLCVRVDDTGCGIPAADLKRVFRPFEQGAPAAGRPPGTGLGLPISARLTKQMGGRLRARSAEGAGSAFWFAVNAPAAAPPARPPAARKGRPLTILLAEDDEVLRRTVVRRLEAEGHRVVAVGGGAEAVEAARSPFDLILMDLHLPGMGGLDAAAAIRRGGGAAPVLAFTASVQPDDLERCRAAGLAGVLPKGFTRREFRRAVAAADRPAPGWLDPPGEILDRMGGRPELLAEVLPAVAAGVRGLAAELAAADGPAVGMLAHRLAGHLGWLSRRAKGEAARLEAAPAGDRAPLLLAAAAVLAELGPTSNPVP